MAELLSYAITDTELAVLESASRLANAPLDTHSWAEAQIALAWHLRQRDAVRARQLYLCVDERLQQLNVVTAWRERIGARMLLVEAEAAMLRMDYSAASEVCQRALGIALYCADACAAADARLLLASLASKRGDRAELLRELEHVYALMHSRDPVRAAVAMCKQAQSELLHAHQQAREVWATRLDALGEQQVPATLAWVCYCRGLLLGLRGDLGMSAQQFLDAHRWALQTGQLGLAVYAAGNAGTSFNLLRAPESAYQWTQEAFELARQSGVNDGAGLALVQCSAALQALGRHESARALIDQALSLLESSGALRERLLAREQLGVLLLETGDAAAALETFVDCLEGNRSLDSAYMNATLRMRQALALLALGRLEEALALVDQLLQCGGAEHFMVDVLDLRARLLLEQWRLHRAGPSLLYEARQSLRQAEAVAGRTPGFSVPVQLYERLAEVCELQGEIAEAYGYAVKAGHALKRWHLQQSVSRSLAVELEQHTSDAKDEHRRLRELALSEHERAADLQRQHETLAALADMGREMATEVDRPAVLAALNAHVRKLLDVGLFAVFQLDPDGQSLELVYGVESGLALPAHAFALDDPLHKIPLCARERCEILIEDDPPGRLAIAGTRHTPSKLFSPLTAGTRLLGVLTVQSFESHAYGERERAIFRSLSAYAAIALANAEAAQALSLAQAQLAEQERQSSLGQLVASIAHEINTPMAVIKSSAESIESALAPTLSRLPQLLSNLDDASKDLLFQLVAHARQPQGLMSSREERAQTRSLMQRLQNLGIPWARQRAELLMRLRAQDLCCELLPLLQHEQAGELLDIADGMATLVRSAANINAALARTEKIAFALRSFSKAEARGPSVDIELRSHLEQALQSHKHLLGQGVELSLSLEPGLTVRGQPDELLQVWSNLIHNALQAMKQRGRLTLCCAADGSYAEVRVSDTGCGIPEALLPRIFEPFFSTKPSGEGSGLGLDIAKRIVQRHGGHIEVRSPPGQGAQFSVRLPRQTLGRS